MRDLNNTADSCRTTVCLACSIIALLCSVGGAASAQSTGAQLSSISANRNILPDTWVGADALGRSLPNSSTVGPLRADRTVGIFYFVWQGSRGDKTPVYDNSKIIADPAHYQLGPVTAFHWWGEPAVGYYHADDPWVARKNLIMLEDAGVDVLFIDVTNAFTYPKAVTTLFEQAEALRSLGQKTPQIAFITHARTGFTVSQLYSNIYSKGLFSDLWFHWHGDPKPFILGDSNGKNDDKSPLDPSISSFFTWRYSWAWDPGQDKWQWMDNSPQRYGWHDDPSKAEEAPVSVAGHPITDIGRSRQNNIEPPLDATLLTTDTGKGDYFAEQWNDALKIDPEFIFVTGWNEWIAQRFVVAPGQRIGFLGQVLPTGANFFVDNYNEEFSRDIMPMAGGYGDNYYMQLVANIRRFKGARSLPVQHGLLTRPPVTDFSKWSAIQPAYLATIGNVLHRNWDGWGGVTYTNSTGRNEITASKVACDRRNIYFFVQTTAPLTKWSDPNWMQLLIDTGLPKQPGWCGYDFIINSRVLNAHTTTLKRYSDGKTWSIPFRSSGSRMVISVPRKLLGLNETDRTTFDFHWVDNASAGPGANIADWWYDGDSAPDGRFNYRYINSE